MTSPVILGRFLGQFEAPEKGKLWARALRGIGGRGGKGRGREGEEGVAKHSARVVPELVPEIVPE